LILSGAPDLTAGAHIDHNSGFEITQHALLIVRDCTLSQQELMLHGGVGLGRYFRLTKLYRLLMGLYQQRSNTTALVGRESCPSLLEST